MELKIEYVDKSELKPYANNAKIHTAEQVDQIKRSIEEVGFNDPIAVWHDNEIIEGHGRLLAVMEMDEIQEVPIIRLDHLTDNKRKAYMLIHNKLTMNTDFDDELLDVELDDITDIDMSLFGFDFDDEDEPQEIVEDSLPEEVETLCKEGDLWILGEHRLICGDSTDATVIDRLMDGVKAQLLLTDPPYGVKAVESGGHNDGKKAGKQMCRDNVYMPVIGDDTTDTARANYDVALTCTENQIIFGRQGVGLFGIKRLQEVLRMENSLGHRLIET